MNRRGNRLELYNRAHYGYEERSELMNYTLPIIFSSEKYMLHFDNAPIGFLDLDSEENNDSILRNHKWKQNVPVGGWKDLGKDHRVIIPVTGRQPMLPSWALGNFSSRFGYHSQEGSS
jgi:alpha-glucosidase (family GH31 glycosyl hydrolase)